MNGLMIFLRRSLRVRLSGSLRVGLLSSPQVRLPGSLRVGLLSSPQVRLPGGLRVGLPGSPKICLATVLLMFAAIPAFSQSSSQREVDPDKSASQAGREKHLLSYPSLREADVFWYKRVWRGVDWCAAGNEHAVNAPLGLAEVLISAVANGQLTAYESGADGTLFAEPISPKEWQQRVAIHPISFQGVQLVEDWMIDETAFDLKPRIRAIGLVAAGSPSTEKQDMGAKVLGWLSFDQARPFLSAALAYRSIADESPRSWDDVLVLGQYQAQLIRISNVEDRDLADNLNGESARLASMATELWLMQFGDSLYSWP